MCTAATTGQARGHQTIGQAHVLQTPFEGVAECEPPTATGKTRKLKSLAENITRCQLLKSTGQVDAHQTTGQAHVLQKP